MRRLASLVSLPTIVTTPGQYQTRSGETVTVLKIVGGLAIGYYSNDTPELWDVSGRLLPFSETKNDIVRQLLTKPE